MERKKGFLIIPIILSLVVLAGISYLVLFDGPENVDTSSVPSDAERAMDSYLQKLEDVEQAEDLNNMDLYVHSDSPEMSQIESLKSSIREIPRNRRDDVLNFISNQGNQFPNTEKETTVQSYEEGNATFFVTTRPVINGTVLDDEILRRSRINVREKNGRWLVWESNIITEDLSSLAPSS